jgi:hypothetical protein
MATYEHMGHWMIDTLDLLRLPATPPVYFVVKGCRLVDSPDRTYFYEEHSCPTNYVQCEAIICDGDDDPHGVFEFVRSVDVPDDYDGKANWRALFPEAFSA